MNLRYSCNWGSYNLYVELTVNIRSWWVLLIFHGDEHKCQDQQKPPSLDKGAINYQGLEWSLYSQEMRPEGGGEQTNTHSLITYYLSGSLYLSSHLILSPTMRGRFCSYFYR